MNFEEELKKRTTYVEEVLKKYLPKENPSYKVLTDAFSYSLMAGGKRLRPIFMLESFRIFNREDVRGSVEEKIVEPFMAALEMIHTYSLVHDDLPAMDNDEYRRGRKTTHVVYGEAMGILAGDSLLNHAFEIVADAMEKEENEEKLRRMVKALKVLATKPSIHGMIGGQVMDMNLSGGRQENPQLAKEILLMYNYKTSALIQCALMCGAYLAGAKEEQVERLSRAGELIGLAFQIRDDILDLTGNMEELGKPIGSDEKNGKNTYVSLVGIEKAQEKVERDSGEAVGIIREMPGDTEFLSALTESLLKRMK